MTYTVVAPYFNKCRRPENRSFGRATFFILFFLLLPLLSFAQKEDEAGDDEITITLEVKGLGAIEAPAVVHGKDVLISVNVLFDYLRIRNTPSQGFDSLTGFYILPQDFFVISKATNKINFKGKVYDLPPGDMVRTETNLYLNLKYFKSVFGLDGYFNFRRLWVNMSSDVELPVVTEMKQEQMRKNVGKLKGDLKADTVIRRTYPLLHLGVADWAVLSTQQSLGATETRANLGLGGLIAGGEANVSLNYYSNQPMTEKQQYYQWRLVNNENSALRQVVAGKIFTQTIASLYAPLVGVQVNNTPTIPRKSYGTYTLSNTTEPGWIVELYINDVLVDYKKSDASGFYSFEVPLIYGYSIIKLKFYGPWGEQRTSQQYISVPFNFLPAREFEYSVTAGIVEDGANTKFYRAGTNYGVSNHVTVGAGFEYLSSIIKNPEIPFVNSSLRLSSHLLLTGEYANGVKSRGILSYRLPSNLQVDLDYTKYEKGQTAIYYNYLEERKVSVMLPFHSAGTSVFSRFSVDQIILPQSKFTNAELAFSGSIKRVGLNLSTYASVADQSAPFVYSIFSVSFLLPKHIYFTSQTQYDFKIGKPDFVKFTFEKQLVGKGFINLNYQEYFVSNNRNILLGIRYDFSFARVSVSALQGNHNTYSRVESASGSFLFDGKTNYANINNRSNVGKGGIVVRPFLDINCNGKWDDGEPRVAGLKLHVNGGRMEVNLKDTTIRIFELEPYTNYYIELDKNSFDNISWQLKKKTIRVTITPNNFADVQVPVSVVGEVSGTVSARDKNGKQVKGMGQLIVSIYDSSAMMVARTLTEPDGYFSYLGLSPGAYTVKFDTSQLHKLRITVAPAEIPIKIHGNREGDLADDLEFKLTVKQDDGAGTREQEEVRLRQRGADSVSANSADGVKPGNPLQGLDSAGNKMAQELAGQPASLDKKLEKRIVTWEYVGQRAAGDSLWKKTNGLPGRAGEDSLWSKTNGWWEYAGYRMPGDDNTFIAFDGQQDGGIPASADTTEHIETVTYTPLPSRRRSDRRAEPGVVQPGGRVPGTSPTLLNGQKKEAGTREQNNPTGMVNPEVKPEKATPTIWHNIAKLLFSDVADFMVNIFKP